jgi:hypothetical protein
MPHLHLTVGTRAHRFIGETGLKVDSFLSLVSDSNHG